MTDIRPFTSAGRHATLKLKFKKGQLHMDKPGETLEQIEAVAGDAADATIADLRHSLKMLQQNPPPVDDTALRERWQNTHDTISSALNQKTVQRRFVAGLIFCGATLLIIGIDLFLL